MFVGPLPHSLVRALVIAVAIGCASAPLATEWWHYDAPGWERRPLRDDPLGSADARRR